MRQFLTPALLCLAITVYAIEQKEISSEERDQYLRRAQVLRKVEVSSMDVLKGPQNEISVPLLAEFVCRYIEPKEKQTGAAPKFRCETPDGRTVRVKWGKESREIYAEVAGSRLLWALGFYADEYYAVRLKCLRCPEVNPANPEPDEPRVDRVFEYAIIERNFPGLILEERKDQGWTWSELDKVSASEGGASRDEIDALKLLAVFLQHADSGPRNQRLACLPEDIDPSKHCSRPVLMIQDLGSTFGSGLDTVHISKMNLADWEERGIWDTKAEAEYTLRYSKPICIGQITAGYTSGEEGLNNPVIFEGGRKLLASLLNRLSADQITNIFRAAGVDRRDLFLEKNGVKKKLTAEDWTSVFLKKRAEINKATCPEFVQE